MLRELSRAYVDWARDPERVERAAHKGTVMILLAGMLYVIVHLLIGLWALIPGWLLWILAGLWVWGKATAPD